MRIDIRVIGLTMVAAVILLPRTSFADELIPRCSSAPGAVPVTNLTDASESEEEALLYRRSYEPDVVLEAEYNSLGKLVCATPLSGQSIYWPHALAAIETKRPELANVTSQRVVVVMPAPGQDSIRADIKDQSLKHATCTPGDPLSRLLRVGRVLLDRNAEQALNCFQLGSKSAPDSFSAIYGVAVAAAVLKQTNLAIMSYDKLVSLLPQFYEARIDQARLYGEAGQNDKEERALKAIIAENPPPPIQMRVADVLTHFYDDQGRRPDALEMKLLSWKTMIEMKRRYSPLVRDYDMQLAGGDLALRLEEAKRYGEAEKQYQDALDLASAKPEAAGPEIFQLEMGRSRCLRKLNNSTAAENICSRWRSRFRELGARLEFGQWRGEALNQGVLELSCGDFSKGLHLLRKAAEHNSNTYDHSDPYRAAAPYWALETIYRSRGDEKRAQLAHNTANQIMAARSTQKLNWIFADTESLFGTEIKQY